MPPPGHLERDEVLRQHGTKADIMQLAEAMGLTVRWTRSRIRCPWPGCDPDRNRGDSVAVRERNGIGTIKCYRCGEHGTAADLIMIRDSVDFAQALQILNGTVPAPRPAPAQHLRLVEPQRADDDRLHPSQINAIWRALSDHEETAETYLSGRDLEFRDPDVLRFTTADHPDAEARRFHGSGRRIAMLCRDVLGQPRGIQYRLTREPRGREPKQRTNTRGVSGRAFMGHPERICDSWLVLVTEGMADTLAAMEWSVDDRRVSGCVVGAAGKDNLASLGRELAENNLDVSGIVFALFPQNDRPENKSRIEFMRLAQLLARMDAHIITVNTPAEHKDVAAWRKASPDVEWPPPDLARGLEFNALTADGQVPVAPPGQALAVRREFRVEYNQQNFSTLCALIDDPVTREAIIGSSESFRMHTRSREIIIGGKSLNETDISNIKVNIELTQKTPEGRPLKFTETEIIKAVTLIASRDQFAPVEEYLRALEWDRTQRLDDGLPRALGVDVGTLEATYLRKWCIQTVRRAIDPGCKADAVLLLVDDEIGGLKKSMFFEVMAGKSWFTDSTINIGDKDALIICGQKWIIEWQELDAVLRAGHNRTKGFITSNQDTFRPPYARNTVTVPRSCVFVGTSNNKRCLQDDGTHLRRWWPIEIRRSIDIRWIEDNRDQIWAEALVAGLGVEDHYLGDEFREVIRDHASKFEYQEEEWSELISRHHSSDKGRKNEYTSAELLTDAIGKPAGQWEQKDQRRIAAACRTLGWSKTCVWRGERTIRVYIPH